jgi:hypothetical protein
MREDFRGCGRRPVQLPFRLATVLITLLLLGPAWSVELFRYRAAAKDGGKQVHQGWEKEARHSKGKENCS